jgi:hypothetical protein
VKYHANPRFWRCYRQLPKEIQRLADESYDLLRQDPQHPSLHFKKMGRFWAARVGLHYRALAVRYDADVVWFWVGPHAEYDRLIRQAL